MIRALAKDPAQAARVKAVSIEEELYPPAPREQRSLVETDHDLLALAKSLEQGGHWVRKLYGSKKGLNNEDSQEDDLVVDYGHDRTVIKSDHLIYANYDLIFGVGLVQRVCALSDQVSSI